MKNFFVAFLLCLAVFLGFDYQFKSEIIQDKVEIVDNYSIILDSKWKWGDLKFEPSFYVSGSDVELTLYSPKGLIAYTDMIEAGKMIDEVIYVKAEPGSWILELKAEKATISYELSMTELLLTSLKREHPLGFHILRLTAGFLLVFMVLAIKSIRQIRKLKYVLDEEQDVEAFMTLSEQLSKASLFNSLKNVHKMNVAVGHIYNGNYLQAKIIIDEIPRNKSGEVKLPKKYYKVFYLNYISLLMELGAIEEAEDMMKEKSKFIEYKAEFPTDGFASNYIKTRLKIMRCHYKEAKDQLIVLKGVAKREEDQALVQYSFAKVYFHLGDLDLAQEYLEKAREKSHFKGLNQKIEELEQMI